MKGHMLFFVSVHNLQHLDVDFLKAKGVKVRQKQQQQKTRLQPFMC